MSIFSKASRLSALAKPHKWDESLYDLFLEKARKRSSDDEGFASVEHTIIISGSKRELSKDGIEFTLYGHLPLGNKSTYLQAMIQLHEDNKQSRAYVGDHHDLRSSFATFYADMFLTAPQMAELQNILSEAKDKKVMPRLTVRLSVKEQKNPKASFEIERFWFQSLYAYNRNALEKSLAFMADCS